jgi:hypothetical protein
MRCCVIGGPAPCPLLREGNVDIAEATRAYEAWVAKELARSGLAPVVPDLARKHRRMAKDGAFAFLRATYYRWAQLWPLRCVGLARAPRVLAVGDLHLENFGTWRDAEGRLCWGVNDFDEAYSLAYTGDLVRLAASAVLAAADGVLKARPGAIADAILDGYATRLVKGGEPYVLEEHNTALREMAYRKEHAPKRWWAKLEAELFSARPPAEARALLAADWPDGALVKPRFCYRSAGLGGLGRPRFVALANWHSSRVAREVKALVPSAAAWAAGKCDAPSRCAEALAKAVRCPDPFLRIERHWVVRRLAPRASKIEFDTLGKKSEALDLLRAMGGEAANVHAGSAGAIAAVRRDLDRRRTDWLADAATEMADAVRGEWKVWKQAKAGEAGAAR